MSKQKKTYKLLAQSFLLFSITMLLAPFYPWWIFAVISVILFFLYKNA